MDTRFWGPDGWKLLHSVAHNYPKNPTNTDKDVYAIFFESLQYILPCIYCRMSYTEYINELPIKNNLDDKNKLTKWIYLIHNKVNDKLRKQGLLHADDPTYESVYKRYDEYIRDINSGKNLEIPGWDFIYCIIFNYPVHHSQIELVRKYHYIIFFKYLGIVIPFNNIKNLYMKFISKHCISDNIETRNDIKKWGYNLERYIYDGIDIPCMSSNQRCRRIEDHRAGCKRKTCRYLEKRAPKLLKTL
jgi:hypothetical protein